MKLRLPGTIHACPYKSLYAITLAIFGFFAASSTEANLLTSGDFEPPTTLGSFLTPTADVWGAESATLSGATGGVSPIGTQMLNITSTGGVTSQVGQQMIGPFTAGTTFTFEALFNASAGGSTLGGLLFIGRDSLTGPDISSTLFSTGSLALDADPNTWEMRTITGTLSVDIAVIETQLYFRNDSLGSASGFVDSANLTTVPLPGTIWFFGSGLFGLIGMARRKVAECDIQEPGPGQY